MKYHQHFFSIKLRAHYDIHYKNNIITLFPTSVYTLFLTLNQFSMNSPAKFLWTPEGPCGSPRGSQCGVEKNNNTANLCSRLHLRDNNIYLDTKWNWKPQLPFFIISDGCVSALRLHLHGPSAVIDIENLTCFKTHQEI